ncbi:hypothetical protein EHS25_007516 [Saitozyma podzolica]|uniref:Integral membrane protein n=1 Tax=Saitozyma podzolica TaxID=1890683 RepID=A0A427YPZ6_9TREE|nr:hypothetical protein EHS25_007516 [Saitozyma podzolica]
MGQVGSALNSPGTPTINVPSNYTTPPFPSLYGPSLVRTQNQEGIFLYEAEAIWHFTLYWTLILLGGTFFLTSIFASFNLFLSLSVFRPKLPKRHSTAPSGIRTPSEHPPSSRSTGASTTPSKSPTNGTGPGQADTGRRERIGRVGRVGRVGRIGPKRPPLWLVALIPLTTGVVAGVISLVSATVVGFALAAVYSAGGFVMSTWVPFLWALIQVLVLIISSYSTLTAIL